MDCGTTNLHYCGECGERKREFSFTYQVIKNETVKKSVIRLKDLDYSQVFKPVEIIEDEKMRILKLEDEKGGFHFVDQKDYLLNREALYARDDSKTRSKRTLREEEEEMKKIDLLDLLESLKDEKPTWKDSLFHR